MKARLQFFLSLAVFWLLFFSLSRILFMIYQFPQTIQLSLSEVITPLLLGIRMDLAMTGYWLILPGLLFCLSPLLSNKITLSLLRITNVTLLVFTTLIIVADLELYKHWGFRLNTTPLMYMQSEAASSANPWILLLLGVLLLIILIGAFLLYKKKIESMIPDFQPLNLFWSCSWLFLTASLILPIRGSLGVAPINTGVVYFHKSKAFPNHAGINPVWNFLKSAIRKDKNIYPSDFYKSAEKEFQLLMQTSGETTQVISATKPNILLIILESFTANIVKPLGGLDDVTPRLNELSKEGIFFTNFYASGDRTDKGLVSILSAYPAQPRTSIIKYPEKTQHLPYLTKSLEKLGYRSSFIYGGDITFANMQSYLTNCSFHHITDENSFDTDLDKSKWGVADHYVFDRLMAECDTASTPFFKVMLSLSSHEPFVVPMESIFKGNDEAAKFKNAAGYTDRSLGEFIQKAKTKDWWNNTLVIITADHGHRLPKKEELKESSRFKIPMLWLGGVIHKDSIVSTFANQTDMANTLLAQLGSPDSHFMFSKNLFAKNKESFALYFFSNGYGYISPKTENIFDFDLKSSLKLTGDEDEANRAKAYVQQLFTDYNKK